ncbi:MAG: class I SAM-dependent methyltransferase [Actinobacteria bacterium]|nr:MAG: class I SAM-dependent methyltransferase [Actinomycetota bacterium]
MSDGSDRPYSRSAAVYDVIYGTGEFDYPGHAAAVTALIEERNPDAATLLEVGCGTGLFLELLVERFAVSGVDVSAEMLAVAAARLPGVPLHSADMRSFILDDRFDAVVCLFSSLGYMTTEADLRLAVTRMAAHLAPGGVLVVDGWLRPEGVIDGYMGLDSAAGDGVTVARMSFTRLGEGVTDLEMHHLVGRPGAGVDYFVERHRMGVYPDEVYVAALTAAGLEGVTVAPGYRGRGRFAGLLSPGRRPDDGE